MIGVDAADIDLIRSLLPALPTFRKLLHEGDFFPLTSTAEYMPGSIWPTFYTGTNPGEHGISQHIQWDPESMRMRRLSADWFYCEPFWYELERQGYYVTAIDVPFSFPSRLKRGVEIINWGSHDLMGRYQGYPANLGREIRQRFGKHPMGYEIPVDKTRYQLETIRRDLVAGARAKANLSRWLIDHTEWDFFLTVFGECHRGGHTLWRDPDDRQSVVPKDSLADVYRAVDASIGQILNGVDLSTTTLIVFSLHGMGANPSQEHLMHRAMDRINASFRAGIENLNATPADTRTNRPGVIKMLRESVPPTLQHAIAQTVPVEVRDWIVGREVIGGIDWSRTPGFALRSDLNGFVRFNLRLRERDGVLDIGTEGYRRYREWVEDNFLSLKATGTNAPVVKDVLSVQDLFPGARNNLLPDLIIRWADQSPAASTFSNRLGEITALLGTGRGGEHRPNGFAVLVGKRPNERRLPPLSHNVEFAEFVLHFFRSVDVA